MSKKKNLKSSIDDLEMEFIEEKMKKDSALNYLTSEGLKTSLKDLFQFHKGTIRTDVICYYFFYFHISIP